MSRKQAQPERGEPCPSCGGTVTEMTFTMKNADTAQLRHCSRCEWRSWSCNGEERALTDVLAAVQREGLPYGRR